MSMTAASYRHECASLLIVCWSLESYSELLHSLSPRLATDRQGLGVCVSVDATRFQMRTTSLFSHRPPTFLSCLKFAAGRA